MDSYYFHYRTLVVSLGVAFFLCCFLLLLSFFFSFSAQKESEKNSEYECGFDPFDNATRQPFEVHFYIVSILFLIFDVEIALLFPWAVGSRTWHPISLWSAVLFLLLLTLGFIYEWKRGALSWPQL